MACPEPPISRANNRKALLVLSSVPSSYNGLENTGSGLDSFIRDGLTQVWTRDSDLILETMHLSKTPIHESFGHLDRSFFRSVLYSIAELTFP